MIPQEKVATFKVGDTIDFVVYDEKGCNDETGDPVDVELTGVILSISGNHAIVEHKYGMCRTWLTIAKHHE